MATSFYYWKSNFLTSRNPLQIGIIIIWWALSNRSIKLLLKAFSPKTIINIMQYSMFCSSTCSTSLWLIFTKTMASSSSSLVFFVVAYLLVVFLGSSNAQLSTTFYNTSCPNLFSTVKSVVQSAINKETRMGASLLRLFFHDCFVNVSITS